MPKFNGNFNKNKGSNEEIPENIDAERWLTDADFIYKNRIYRLGKDFKITKVDGWLLKS